MQKLFLYNKGTTIFLVGPRLKVEINKFHASLNFLINLVEKINTRSDKPQSLWNLATIQLAAPQSEPDKTDAEYASDSHAKDKMR